MIFSFCALSEYLLTVIYPSDNHSVLQTTPFFFSFFFKTFFLFQDLSSPNQYDTGVALTGLSCFVTPDLARDLANDIMTLVSHGEYVKRFINKDLCSLVVFLQATVTPHV